MVNFGGKESGSLRRAICDVCVQMTEKGYISGPSGNVSVRVNDDRYLVTPSLPDKHLLHPNQILLVDWLGQLLATEFMEDSSLTPTTEIPMHMAIYQARPDIKAIIHAHPQNATLIAGNLMDITIHSADPMEIKLEYVPCAPHMPHGTIELANAVTVALGEHHAVLLPYHGVVTTGKTLLEALARLERLEIESKRKLQDI